jgi:transposase
VRFTARAVEIFHQGERIAAHQRMSGNHKHTTVPEHMAFSHHRYAGWTIVRIRQDAAAIGPATSALYDLILDEHSHPEQGFRAGLGILRLASSGRERLDAEAARAIDIRQPCGRRLWQPKPPRMTLQWSLKLAVLL